MAQCPRYVFSNGLNCYCLLKQQRAHPFASRLFSMAFYQLLLFLNYYREENKKKLWSGKSARIPSFNRPERNAVWSGRDRPATHRLVVIIELVNHWKQLIHLAIFQTRTFFFFIFLSEWKWFNHKISASCVIVKVNLFIFKFRALWNKRHFEGLIFWGARKFKLNVRSKMASSRLLTVAILAVLIIAVLAKASSPSKGNQRNSKLKPPPIISEETSNKNRRTSGQFQFVLFFLFILI